VTGNPGAHGLGTLEHVPCDGCGADDARPVTTRPDGLTVVECRCGLAYLSPRPVDLSQFYEPGYFSGGQEGIGYGDGECRTWIDGLRRSREMRARLTALQDSVDLEGADLLEIGCGTGDFAALAAEAGATVKATDLSAEAVDLARRRHAGLDVSQAAYNEVHGAYDIVCAFEVIEHVASPRAFLDAMSRLVRPGGVLALSTPDYAMAAQVQPDTWLGFAISMEHLFYLSNPVLAQMAGRAGFEVEAWFGMGDGRIPLPRSASRARQLAARVPFARQAKAWMETPPHYERSTVGHDLLAVLRRHEGTSGA
jgi:SAM-dependent methyltransferase